MRALLIAVVGAAALFSLPAEASHWHVWPYFGFSYGAGPYPYYGPGYDTARTSESASTSARLSSDPAPARRSYRSAAQGALKLYALSRRLARARRRRPTIAISATSEAAGRSQAHDPTLGAGSRDDGRRATRARSRPGMEGRAAMSSR